MAHRVSDVLRRQRTTDERRVGVILQTDLSRVVPAWRGARVGTVRERVGARRPDGWDVALAAVVVGVSSALLLGSEPAPGFRSPDLVTWLLTLGGAVSVG